MSILFRTTVKKLSSRGNLPKDDNASLLLVKYDEDEDGSLKPALALHVEDMQHIDRCVVRLSRFDMLQLAHAILKEVL